MNSQLKTILFDKKFVLVLFILLHVFLFNINEAEWGDSYRMLRASEFIRKGVYPSDEKRPPLFPIILALRPANIDPVTWGRGVMLVTGILFFLVFSAFASNYIKDKRFLLMAQVAFSLNPVFLYWSIRVMSDVPFAFLCLLTIYWLGLWGKSLDFGKALLLGFLAGLSILMRFEGYLLSLSLLGGMLLNGLVVSASDMKLKKIAGALKANFVKSLVFLVTLGLTILPYLLVRNPFNSSYFEETSGRKYDLTTVWIFLLAFVFSFGLMPVVYLVLKQSRSLLAYFATNISLLLFVVLELMLILVWPAAIPRLFVSIIPLLIVPLVLAVKNYLTQKRPSLVPFLIINFLVLAVFIVSQYFLRQQFLVPQKWWFALLILLQIPVLVTLYLRNLKVFFPVLVANLLVWSMSPIFLHKDTFISVKKAAQYAVSNLSGVVAYNDVSSVSDWYINYTAKGGKLVGYYYNTESRKNLTFEALKTVGMDYLIITNEHNTSMTLDLNKRPYLEELRDFSYNIGGKAFFAKVLKFNKEYSE